MDIDVPKGSSFEYRVLSTPGFPGTNGDGYLHLVGLTGSDGEADDVRLWVVNAKPSIDVKTGELLDQSEHGANSTVELFSTGSQAKALQHVRTFSDAQIATPNNVAAVGDEGSAFYFTNDHGLAKTGWVS